MNPIPIRYSFVEKLNVMNKIAKILYGVNSVLFILIGILHTLAHYADLVTDEIRAMLDHTAIVSGIESSIWELWQGMSLLMGFLMIAFGLLNLSIIYRLPKGEFPPISSSVIMIAILLTVLVVGYNYFSFWQVYGSIFGITLQSICLILSLRGK